MELTLKLRYTPVPESGCWLWTGFWNRGGYGRFRHDGKKMLSHRFSWLAHNGQIPAGMHVLHKCDTPACVNPNHLFLGSIAENNADKVSKSRQSRGEKHSRVMKVVAASGERAGRAFLTDTQVRDIRDDHRNNSVVARAYGVSHQCIRDIRNGRTRRGA